MIRVDTTAGTLTAFGAVYPCSIGRSGACPAPDKREGDGRTPLGEWAIGTVLFGPGQAVPAGMKAKPPASVMPTCSGQSMASLKAW